MDPSIPTISPHDVRSHKGAMLIDVRRPDEYVGELGHIAGAVLKTLGPELDEFLSTLNKNEIIIFICRSGARSGKATLQALELGFTSVFNMEGGMLTWNSFVLPIER